MNTPAEKISSFEKQIAFFHSFSQAHAKIEMAMESTRLRGIPTSAVLIGPSGSGKSTLCKIIENEFPEKHTHADKSGIMHIIPVFYCSVPASVTVKSFCKTMLTTLECADLRGDSVDLFLRLIQLLKNCRTELIIIDEFQTLAKLESAHQLNSVIDWLLSLINALSIPIICAGTIECKHIIYKEDRLARRFPFLAELRHLSFDLKPESDYMTLLNLLDEKMYEIGEITQGGAHLTDANICSPLFVATQGSLEYLRQILSRAMTTCLSRSRSELHLNDFEDACSSLQLKLCLSKRANPFMMTLKECYALIESSRND
ncbi:TniB family NTP-binding protein [Pseudomonas sp. NY15181]|uniref:TniB family NTP-binding protein n=1 Tax=Pseudomonas sp. NY15181 TaxID=3400349 RepID=UPI003A850BF2